MQKHWLALPVREEIGRLKLIETEETEAACHAIMQTLRQQIALLAEGREA